MYLIEDQYIFTDYQWLQTSIDIPSYKRLQKNILEKKIEISIGFPQSVHKYEYFLM